EVAAGGGQGTGDGHCWRSFPRQVFVVGQRERLTPMSDDARAARSDGCNHFTFSTGFARAWIRHPLREWYGTQELSNRSGLDVSFGAATGAVSSDADIVGAGWRDTTMTVVAECDSSSASLDGVVAIVGSGKEQVRM